MVKDEEIQETLSTVKDLEEATKILIDKANQGGGRDNITTILVRVQDAKGASAGTMPARTATAPS
jgi:protein phosphatase